MTMAAAWSTSCWSSRSSKCSSTSYWSCSSLSTLSRSCWSSSSIARSQSAARASASTPRPNRRSSFVCSSAIVHLAGRPSLRLDASRDRRLRRPESASVRRISVSGLGFSDGGCQRACPIASRAQQLLFSPDRGNDINCASVRTRCCGRCDRDCSCRTADDGRRSPDRATSSRGQHPACCSARLSVEHRRRAS